jgi:hypothetical protein
MVTGIQIVRCLQRGYSHAEDQPAKRERSNKNLAKKLLFGLRISIAISLTCKINHDLFPWCVLKMYQNIFLAKILLRVKTIFIIGIAIRVFIQVFSP